MVTLSLASEAKKFAIAETLEELKYARIGKTIYLYRSFGRKVGCYITDHNVRFAKLVGVRASGSFTFLCSVAVFGCT